MAFMICSPKNSSYTKGVTKKPIPGSKSFIPGLNLWLTLKLRSQKYVYTVYTLTDSHGTYRQVSIRISRIND